MIEILRIVSQFLNQIVFRRNVKLVKTYAMLKHRITSIWSSDASVISMMTWTCFFSIVARFGGMLLNFNCMLILVLVLRKCHTLIRSTPLAAILPLDQYIAFHKMVGGVIGVCAATHTGAHIAYAGTD
jgi:hypothetical protein